MKNKKKKIKRKKERKRLRFIFFCSAGQKKFIVSGEMAGYYDSLIFSNIWRKVTISMKFRKPIKEKDEENKRKRKGEKQEREDLNDLILLNRYLFHEIE